MNIIKNVLTNDEIDFMLKENKLFSWELRQTSDVTSSYAIFWFKNLLQSKTKELFTHKISTGLEKNVFIERIYCNGQSFGQCGFWHEDVTVKSENIFTLVYFYQHWLPEYGGHFMIEIDEEIVSILPEYNKAILFPSYCSHMALGPSRHCLTQRESLAVKFFIL